MLASNWVVFRCYSCRQQAGGLPGTNLTCGYCRAWLQVPPPLPLPVFYPSPNVLPPLPVHPPPLHARVEGALKRARPVLSGGVSAAAKRGRGNGPSEPGRDDTHKGVKEIGHAVEWTAEDERSLGDWVCKVKQNAAKKAVEWYLKTADDAVALQLQITAADSEYQGCIKKIFPILAVPGCPPPQPHVESRAIAWVGHQIETAGDCGGRRGFGEAERGA
eukprot:Hpha_TRINITY_DN14478_c0_g1::TRINITY_DN14478_c0_g1_i2::g.157441::m.157441